LKVSLSNGGFLRAFKKPPLALVSDGFCRGVSYEARDHHTLPEAD